MTIESYPQWSDEYSQTLWFNRVASQLNLTEDLMGTAMTTAGMGVTTRADGGAAVTDDLIIYPRRYLRVVFAQDASGTTPIPDLSTYTGSTIFVGTRNADTVSAAETGMGAFFYQEFDFASGANSFYYNATGGGRVIFRVQGTSDSPGTGFTLRDTPITLDLEAGIATGADGTSVFPVYADNASGMNASLTQGNREFIFFFRGTSAPSLPNDVMSEVFVRFRGQDGSNGQTFTRYFADSATGGNISTTRGTSQRFFRDVTHTVGVTPTAPTTGFTLLIGEDGTNGQDAYGPRLEYQAVANQATVGNGEIRLDSVTQVRLGVFDQNIATQAITDYLLTTVQIGDRIRLIRGDNLGVFTGTISARARAGEQITLTLTGGVVTGSFSPGDATVEFTRAIDGEDGESITGPAGNANRLVDLFRVTTDTTTPTDVAGTFTYTFATGVLSGGTLNGWTQARNTVPNGSYEWNISALAQGNGTTVSIPHTAFSAPTRIGHAGEDGSAGTNTAVFSLYRVSNSNTTAPAAFSGTFTYTFATGAVTGGTLNSWSTTPPTVPAGSFLWQRTAVATGTGTTDTVATSEFSAARVISGTGTNGSNGADALAVDVSLSNLFVQQNVDGTYPATNITVTGNWRAGSNTVTRTLGTIAVATDGGATFTAASGATNTVTLGSISYTPAISFTTGTRTITLTTGGLTDTATVGIGTRGTAGANGNVQNWIFIDVPRSADSTDVPTPAASAGIPTVAVTIDGTDYNWADVPPTSPTGAIWASQGSQAGGTGNFTWGTPQRLTGTTGVSSRIDFAYATNRPEVQNIAVTGTRSNAQTAGTGTGTPGTMTLSLPNNFNSGADQSHRYTLRLDPNFNSGTTTNISSLQVTEYPTSTTTAISTSSVDEIQLRIVSTGVDTFSAATTYDIPVGDRYAVQIGDTFEDIIRGVFNSLNGVALTRSSTETTGPTSITLSWNNTTEVLSFTSTEATWITVTSSSTRLVQMNFAGSDRPISSRSFISINPQSSSFNAASTITSRYSRPASFSLNLDTASVAAVDTGDFTWSTYTSSLPSFAISSQWTISSDIDTFMAPTVSSWNDLVGNFIVVSETTPNRPTGLNTDFFFREMIRRIGSSGTLRVTQGSASAVLGVTIAENNSNFNTVSSYLVVDSVTSSSGTPQSAGSITLDLEIPMGTNHFPTPITGTFSANANATTALGEIRTALETDYSATSSTAPETVTGLTANVLVNYDPAASLTIFDALTVGFVDSLGASLDVVSFAAPTDGQTFDQYVTSLSGTTGGGITITRVSSGQMRITSSSSREVTNIGTTGIVTAFTSATDESGASGTWISRSTNVEGVSGRVPSTDITIDTAVNASLTGTFEITDNSATNTTETFTNNRVGSVNTEWQFDPDIDNQVYTTSIPRQQLPDNQNAVAALTTMAAAITGLSTTDQITWGGASTITVGTSMTSVDIVLHTTIFSIRPELTMFANTGSNVEPTVDVGRQSSYRVLDYLGREVIAFTSSVSDTLSSDREFVIARIVDGITDNNEMTGIGNVDFTAQRSGSTIVITAVDTGVVTGLFSITVNHGGGGGNLAFGTATVTQEGTATLTTNATSFPTGTLTANNYVAANPAGHNFIGERVVFWGEGQTNETEPAVSTDTADYAFTRLT